MENPPDLAADLSSLGEPVEELLGAFERRELGAILAGVSRCHGALERWDELRGLGIVTPEIARMIDLAGSCGAAAKVSGAGGGDSVIAFARGDAAIDRVRERWRAEGFRPLDLQRSERGAGKLR